jgi:hypothetical protein
MLIFDRENWRHHWAWCLVTLLATATAVIFYLTYGFTSGSWRWPGGASPPGFAFGLLGGGIIVFEMLLWPRKYWWRGWRLGRTKWWMAAHVWLGLLTLPLLLLHGDFHFNLASSTLAAVLMWLLVVVVGSGFFGLVMQNIIPRIMLDRVPAETIYSQIPDILEQYRVEGERLVEATCGPPPRDGARSSAGARERPGAAAPFIAVETVRQVGRIQGKVVDVGIEARYVPDSEPLRAFFHDQVAPFLSAKSGKNLPLGSAGRAASRFSTLKAALRPEAHAVVDRLADLCDQRRQFDLQSLLHGWLFTWLGVHVAFSVSLLVLMIIHIIFALRYV